MFADGRPHTLSFSENNPNAVVIIHKALAVDISACYFNAPDHRPSRHQSLQEPESSPDSARQRINGATSFTHRLSFTLIRSLSVARHGQRRRRLIPVEDRFLTPPPTAPPPADRRWQLSTRRHLSILCTPNSLPAPDPLPECSGDSPRRAKIIVIDTH